VSEKKDRNNIHQTLTPKVKQPSSNKHTKDAPFLRISAYGDSVCPITALSSSGVDTGTTATATVAVLMMVMEVVNEKSQDNNYNERQQCDLFSFVLAFLCGSRSSRWLLLNAWVWSSSQTLSARSSMLQAAPLTYSRMGGQTHRT
jgi:hypothetical protein